MRLILVTLFSVCLSLPASAQVFFTMDMSSGAQPLAGWDEVNGTSSLGTKWSRTFVENGWAMGVNAYRLAQEPWIGCVVDPTFCGGQYHWGWKGEVEGSDPAAGATRYYRFRMRFSADTNWQAADLPAPSAINNKIIMIGDTCSGAPCRVVVNYAADGCWCRAQWFRIQIDGGEEPAQTGPLLPNVDLNLQIEVRTATNGSSANGGYKLWLNNDTYASPSATKQDIQLNPDFHRHVSLGAYENGGIYADGVHEFLITEFEASTTFDSTWAADDPEPSGAPVRIRRLPPLVMYAAPVFEDRVAA